MKATALLLILLCTIASANDFRPRQVVEPFEAITTPNIVSSAESEEWVRDDELVLGVKIGKQARAYSINMLTNPSREIINDRLGKKTIAATW